MNKLKNSLLGITYAFSLSSVTQAAIVFQDDFSEADGTALNGKAPDIGSNWNVTVGSAGLNVNGGSVDTQGAARAAFGGFTALGAGERLTLTYDTVATGGTFFTAGFAGVSLFVGGSGGSEPFFTGDPGSGGAASWGVVGIGAGGDQITADTTVATSATFVYTYDTGAWTFTTTSGINLAGTGTANLAIDTLRFANGGGGDIAVDNFAVDISAVPEPSSSALLGLGGIALMLRRRK